MIFQGFLEVSSIFIAPAVNFIGGSERQTIQKTQLSL